MSKMYVIKGSIVDLDVDIIVNAANKTLLGGGGVDGIIHRKAGKELLEECKTLGGCETGESKMTDGYNLYARKIIHTVGPVYSNGTRGEPTLLENCYLNSMTLAEEYRVKTNKEEVTIAFPCISTGVYHFPKDKACDISVNTIKKINNKNIKVIFVCFEDEDYKLYLDKVHGIKLL